LENISNNIPTDYIVIDASHTQQQKELTAIGGKLNVLELHD